MNFKLKINLVFFVTILAITSTIAKASAEEDILDVGEEFISENNEENDYKDEVFNGLELSKIKSNYPSFVNGENEKRIFNDIFEAGAIYTDDSGMVENDDNLNPNEDTRSKNENNAPDISSLSSSEDEDAKKSTPKTFYLSSIIKTDDGSWTVWLNDVKYRKSEKKVDNLEVKSLKDNVADVYYHLGNLSIEFPSDSATIKSVSKEEIRKIRGEDEYNWDYKSADNKIFIDSVSRVINFKLKTNQKFSLESFEVSEGKASIENSGKAEANLPIKGKNQVEKETSKGPKNGSEKEESDIFNDIVNKYKIKK